jgi:hypothetical protein
MLKKCIDPFILLKYIDRQLPEKERIAVEKHLANCDYCLKLLVATDRSLKDKELMQWASVPVSRDLARAVLDNLPQSFWKMFKNQCKKIIHELMDIFKNRTSRIYRKEPVLVPIMRSSQRSIYRNSDIPTYFDQVQFNDFNLEIINYADKKAKTCFKMKSIKYLTVIINIAKTDGSKFSLQLRNNQEKYRRLAFGIYSLSIKTVNRKYSVLSRNKRNNTMITDNIVSYQFKINENGFEHNENTHS